MSDKRRGRPMKYSSAKKLLEAVEDYFDSISYTTVLKDGHGQPILSDSGREFRKLVYVTPPGKSAMCLHIGIDESTWDNYADAEKNPELAPVTRWAKMRMEAYLEEQLNTRDRTQGIIFNLENNYGWKNRREVDLKGSVDGKVHAEVLEMSLEDKMRMIAEAARDSSFAALIEDGGAGGSEDEGTDEED